MGYRLLGMAVWKGGKLYLRRRVDTRKLAIEGAVVLALVGGLVVALRSGGDS